MATKYDPQLHLPLIVHLTSAGLTVRQIAVAIGVPKSTVAKWIDQHDMRGPINEAREVVDRLVEGSLLQRARGFTVTEEIRERLPDPNGVRRWVITKRITKQVIPNVAACIYWLRNRQPNDWREHREPEPPPVEQQTDWSVYSDDELRTLRDLAAKGELGQLPGPA